MKKAIFWDNDGVLVDTEKLYYQATREKLGELGVELTLELYCEFLLKQSRGAWHLAREKGVEAQRIDEMVLQRNDRYSELISQGDLIVQGAQDVIRELSSFFRMAIVTSSRIEHFELIHQRTNFLSFMEFVITNKDYTQSKPDPEPYLMALERTGLAPEDCLVIEDSERGLCAAVAAGIECWVIPTALSQGSDFSKASKVLHSILEIPQLLAVTQ